MVLPIKQCSDIYSHTFRWIDLHNYFNRSIKFLSNETYKDKAGPSINVGD